MLAELAAHTTPLVHAPLHALLSAALMRVAALGLPAARAAAALRALFMLQWHVDADLQAALAAAVAAAAPSASAHNAAAIALGLSCLHVADPAAHRGALEAALAAVQRHSDSGTIAAAGAASRCSRARRCPRRSRTWRCQTRARCSSAARA
jgi:hypothetical protein